MDRVTILVHPITYIHIFYSTTQMLLFDGCDEEAIVLAQSAIFKSDFYTKNELKKLPKQDKRKIVYIFTTHHHYDHCKGIKNIKCSNKIIGESDNKQVDTEISGNPDKEKNTEPVEHTALCKDRQKYECGDGVVVTCIHTPCHTRDSFCYFVETGKRKYLITGDTLFFLGVGKFFEGDAEDMKGVLDTLKSVVSRDALCLYGHDYNKENIYFCEKKGVKIPDEVKKERFLRFVDEIKYNPFLNDPQHKKDLVSKDNIETLREEKDAITGKEEN